MISDNVPRLRDELLDTKRPLFERYRAMFALRNIGNAAAVDALAEGFADDSALFKYVIVLCSHVCLCASRGWSLVRASRGHLSLLYDILTRSSPAQPYYSANWSWIYDTAPPGCHT